MIRLTVVTLAALYTVLHVFGDETRRPADVSRAETPLLSVDLASYLPDLPDTPTVSLSDRMSEGEAVQKALDAGRVLRAERKSKPRQGSVVLASASASGDAPSSDAAWYVTGERVNLRGGPGTANAVVGQATFGTEAAMLEVRDGWYLIRLSDGSEAWIFGKFLSESRPG